MVAVPMVAPAQGAAPVEEEIVEREIVDASIKSKRGRSVRKAPAADEDNSTACCGVCLKFVNKLRRDYCKCNV